MDDGIFSGNTPEEKKEPLNPDDAGAGNDTAENDALNADYISNANEQPADEQADEKADGNDDIQPVATGEYHYNREQYNSQFGSHNTGYQPPYSQPNNQGYAYNPNMYSQQGNPQGGTNPYAYAAPSSQPPKKKNKGIKVFIALIAVIVVLAIALTVAIFANDNGVSPGTSNGETITGDFEQDNSIDTDNVGDIQSSESSNGAGEAVDVAEIAKKFNVGILVYQNNSLYTEGSGVVVKEDDDGKYTYIVTCAHVVNYANVSLSVLMEDGSEYPADLVGLDTRTDLAVVRIEASGLDKAEIADSDSLVVGQTVYAVGNPGGSEFFGSVTNGIISAIDRPVSSSTGYEMECIQHTSAINPGNSGGALVNGEGKLIGINSMKIASTEYEGMGFSVPSNVVVEVFNSIIENGYVAGRAKLGISYTTPSNYSQTYAMYVQMKGLPSGTIVVAEVNADSDLADKDVVAGDMITHVNGKAMTDSGMLSGMIEDMSAGDTLTLTIVRVNPNDWSQTEFDVTVELVEDKGTSATQSAENENSNENPFGNGGNSGSYEDWYEFYKEYFGY